MEEKLKKFVSYIEHNMQVKLSFKKDNFYYFQYCGLDDINGSATYIAGAKHFAGISPDELQVLVEYPTSYGKRKFAFHGHQDAVNMLQKTYGGYVALKHYWLLDAIPNDNKKHPFGYNPKLYYPDNIKAQVILEQVRHSLPH